jgi:tRNA nucleotidyltransferase (CCA-adding enzyme)
MTVIQRTDKFMAEHFGDQAFRVGGSVRDELLGRRPKDGDYVVQGHDLRTLNARLSQAGMNPALIKDRAGHKLGFRVKPRGLPPVEVVLPRTERKIETGVGNERHNFEIMVDPNLPLADDALRRDFTFNAIYRNAQTGEIMDPLNGREALDRKFILTTQPESYGR